MFVLSRSKTDVMTHGSGIQMHRSFFSQTIVPFFLFLYLSLFNFVNYANEKGLFSLQVKLKLDHRATAARSRHGSRSRRVVEDFDKDSPCNKKKSCL